MIVRQSYYLILKCAEGPEGMPTREISVSVQAQGADEAYYMGVTIKQVLDRATAGNWRVTEFTTSKRKGREYL